MNPSTEQITLKKISWRIVPFVMFAYFIAFFDRINIGFAALTMNQDLGFSSTVFGIGAGMFFIGYFLTDVPSNVILQKVGPRIWLARIMVCWVCLAPFLSEILAMFMSPYLFKLLSAFNTNSFNPLTKFAREEFIVKFFI